MTFISKLLKHVLMKQKPTKRIKTHCDTEAFVFFTVTDVNIRKNSSQERWQHDLRLTRSYPPELPGVKRVTQAGVTLEVVGGPTQGSQVAVDGGCERDVVHRMNEGTELGER